MRDVKLHESQAASQIETQPSENFEANWEESSPLSGKKNNRMVQANSCFRWIKKSV